MSRRPRIPSYRLHKQSGQAVVTLTDPSGRRRDVLLGKHGAAESRREYARVLAEWEASGRVLTQAGAPPSAASSLSINEIILLFWKHAEQHYRHRDGTPTNELTDYRYSLKPLRARGHMARGEFALACRILAEAIAQSPQASQPRRLLSHVLLQEGKDWPAAERALRDLLALEPNDAEARNNLALLLRQQNR